MKLTRLRHNILYALFTLYMPLTSSRTEIKRPPQQHTNKISKLKYFNFWEENRDTRFRKVIRFPNIFRIFCNWIFGNMIILIRRLQLLHCVENIELIYKKILPYIDFLVRSRFRISKTLESSIYQKRIITTFKVIMCHHHNQS